MLQPAAIVKNVILSIIFVLLVVGLSYLITLPTERWAESARYDHDITADTKIMETIEQIQENRSTYAERLANQLRMYPNATDTEKELDKYLFSVFENGYRPPEEGLSSPDKRSEWTIITQTLLLRDPLPRSSSIFLLRLIRLPLIPIASILACVFCGSVAFAVFFIVDRIFALVFVKSGGRTLMYRRLFAMCATAVTMFLYMAGTLILIALTANVPTKIDGIVAALKKMVSMYEILGDQEPLFALHQLVARLLLISSFAAFLFSLCRIFQAMRTGRLAQHLPPKEVSCEEKKKNE